MPEPASIPTLNTRVSHRISIILYPANLRLVLLTLLLPRDAEVFRISHQEMIKGVRLGGNGSTLKFYETLEVPIIENTADEEDLTDGMAAAMEKYPNAAAILVRRHGVYVWGESAAKGRRAMWWSVKDCS